MQAGTKTVDAIGYVVPSETGGHPHIVTVAFTETGPYVQCSCEGFKFHGACRFSKIVRGFYMGAAS